MDKPYDYISVNDFFWIKFGEHLVSFSFKGMPKDIHFSLSFHPDNPRANFHVTRNAGNPLSKPKITIVEIDKNISERMVELLSRRFLRFLLKPFDMRQFRLNNRNKAGFISYEDLEKGKHSDQMQNDLKNAFTPITTFPRKTRIKIKGNVESHLGALSNSKEYLRRLESYIVRVKNIPENGFIGGMLLTKKEVRIVLRIDNRWFELNLPTDIRKAFATLADEKTINVLYSRFKKAIVRVRNANTYEQVEEYDKPPLLFFKNADQ